MKTFIKFVLPAVMLGLSSVANAALIDGSIAFAGSTDTDTGNLATANVVTPTNAYVAPGQTVGDFVPYVFDLQPVAYSSFTIDPITVPVAGIWSVGGFSFTLENMVITQQTTSTLALIGTGTISGNGFDPTDGFWTFTANKNATSLSFSSGTNSVPEPGLVALFAIGLLGMGLSKKIKGRA
jgi:hypothetical protein